VTKQFLRAIFPIFVCPDDGHRPGASSVGCVATTGTGWVVIPGIDVAGLRRTGSRTRPDGNQGINMNRMSGFKRIPSTRGAAVENYPGFMKRLIVGSATTVLVSGGVGLAGLGLGAGTAHAAPDLAPQYRGPVPENHWCPGNDPSGGPGGPFNTSPPNWDWHVCHTYWIVPAGQGNVSPGIWEGDTPPLPAPQPWTPLPGL